MPWQNLLHAGQENLFSGLTALTAEFTVGEGKLMTHDEPCSMAPDDKHDLISGTCSHLPWQNEGRVSRRLPVTTSSDTGVELLPVEITPDEQKEPVAAIAPSLSTSTQTRVSASSCKVEFRHGNMTLENPSPELLTVLIRELTGRGR
ncbi:hypothetical protein ECP03047993_5264 [Escherichia coli P0304799.3]|nr:hypothetical protein ECP03047993_5264 [Escherichia coli P0304799.3]